MKIYRKQAIVIYGTSMERIASVLDSGIFRGCNVVGVCTDELVLGDSDICEIPIIQMDEINPKAKPIVLLLDDNIPEAFKRVAFDKGISMFNYRDISFADDEEAEDSCYSKEVLTFSDSAKDDDFNDNLIVEGQGNIGEEKDDFPRCDKQTSDGAEKNENAPTCFSDEQAEAICNSMKVCFEKIYQAINNTKNKDNRNYSIQTEKQKELIADYIKKNLKDASLCGAASALGYSSPYAATWIKKNMGKSFTSLLLDERCKNAARLLRESDMPIKDIITECGYENSSFFRKIFFARLGKSPLEYRKFYRNK